MFSCIAFETRGQHHVFYIFDRFDFSGVHLGDAGSGCVSGVSQRPMQKVQALLDEVVQRAVGE
jgi:hypothetical protein